MKYHTTVPIHANAGLTKLLLNLEYTRNSPLPFEFNALHNLSPYRSDDYEVALSTAETWQCNSLTNKISFN